MAVRALLEIVQRDNAAADGGRTYDERAHALYVKNLSEYDPETRKMLEENLRRQDALLARYADRAPTPYQSLIDYVKLAQAKDRIDDTLRRVGIYKPCDNLVLGSAESRHLNAMTAYSPGNWIGP